VDFFPDIGDVVGHVCGFEEIVFCLHEVCGGVHVFLGEEFKEREDELAVEEGDQFLCKIVFLTLKSQIFEDGEMRGNYFILRSVMRGDRLAVDEFFFLRV